MFASQNSYILFIGLCASKAGLHCNIVLAGDPKQLDAVCKSSKTAKLGYKISLMDRLYNRPLYAQHPSTKKFNPKFITQLVQNYRSHPAILYVANKLFYNGSLVPKASPG